MQTQGNIKEVFRNGTRVLRRQHKGEIEVPWVSGHTGIEGNDRAGEIAKEATELEPITEVTTVARHY